MPPPRRHERAEGGEVFNVLVEVVGFVRLEAGGCVFEARVVDDVAKSFASDFSLADVFVPIYARIQICFGIVEVKGDDLFSPNSASICLTVLSHPLGKRISCRKQKVGGIDANGEAFRDFTRL